MFSGIAGLVATSLLAMGIEGTGEISWPYTSGGACANATWGTSTAADQASTVNGTNGYTALTYATANLDEKDDPQAQWAQTTNEVEFCRTGGSSATFRARAVMSGGTNDTGRTFTFRWAVGSAPADGDELLPGTAVKFPATEGAGRYSIAVENVFTVPGGECVALLGTSSGTGNKTITLNESAFSIEQISGC